MKRIIFFLSMLSLNICLADEVKIELNPTKPVSGEVFQAHFRIFTDSDEEPVINFSPNGVEVVNKSNQGISTRTVYSNGKLTVTREINIVYELVASKVGYSALRDINIHLGNKTIRHPTLSIPVIKEPEVMADVFVMADVPKKDLFLGEGIVVRYYLYCKNPVNALDIKTYPKLNNFTKRFIQEPERTERVSVDGEIYIRVQVYAAKLFPEKVGELKIDSLRLTASYPDSRSLDPFGAFGLNRDFKTKSLQSEIVKINVKPLPEPIPLHFTGLIGTHEFELDFGQNKLIVNEPLEVKLSITGVGALESLEAPEIIKATGLEEFESNGDLKITDANQATKVFDYTFLAKENLQMPPRTLTLSFFDPNAEKYVTKELAIPEIVVAGGNQNQPPKAASTNDPTPGPVRKELPLIDKTFALPKISVNWNWKSSLPVINLFLALIAVLISLTWIIRNKSFSRFKSITEIPTEFKKGRFTLNEFIRWITPLIQLTGKSPLMIIRDSSLPEESKRYFIDLLNANDYKDYSTRKAEMQFKYQPAHFKQLGRYIASVGNEDSSQST